jgi:glycosyltransferase involved in cell wall biosynthesis
MKTILIITNSTHGGGAENAMLLLHNYFLKIGLDSNLVAINDMDGYQEMVVEKTFLIHRKWSDGLIQTLKGVRKFNKINKDINPSVIIANCELPELYVALIRTNALTIYAVEHTTRPWNGRRAFGFMVRLILWLKSAKWITVNQDQKVVWPCHQDSKWIPNPVAEKSENKAVESGMPHGTTVFVGRLREEKSPRLLLEACKKLSIPLTLYGDGNLAEELKSRYGDSGLIRFMGYKHNLWSEISSHSLIVVPSEYEGDGLVVVEALQNGNSILLRDNVDLRRFSLDESNYFGDFQELVKKLESFRDDPNIYKVHAAVRDRVLKPRSLESVAKQWVSLIDFNNKDRIQRH